MQYSTNVRKKDGGYQYIITYKQNGKWKTRSKQGFKKSSEAKDHMVQVIKELEKIVDSGVKSENVTLQDFCEEYKKHMELYKSPATIMTFNSAYRAYKLPNKELGKITRMDIQKSIDRLIKENKVKLSTIKKYSKTMQTFFNCAKKDYKLIAENPFDDITFPKEKTEITTTIDENGKKTVNKTVEKTVKTGISFGSALAMIISYTAYKSIGWAIVHGVLSWIYVIYYIIRY